LQLRYMWSLSGALVAAGTVAWLYLLLVLLDLPSRWAIATALLYAFGTYTWAYSKLGFYDIHLAFFQLLAIVAAIGYQASGKLFWCLLAGLMLGWGIATRPTLILALPPLAAYVAWAGAKGQRVSRASSSMPTLSAAALKPLLAFGLAMVPWLLIIIWYNLQRTGAPLGFGYPSYDHALAQGPAAFASAVFGLMLSTGRGFFLYSPVALLMFWGIKPLWAKRRVESILVWSIVAITGAFFCSRAAWYGQWPWGPRYLLVLTPLVMAAVGFALPDLWPRRGWRRLIIALIVISCLVQVLSVVVPYGTYIHHVEDVTIFPHTWAASHFAPGAL